MKKIFSAVIFLFIFTLSISVSAADVTGEVNVYNSKKQEVASFEIVTNNLTVNARSAIQKALDYCKNNASPADIHTVKIPKGEYCVYSSLDVYGNTVIDLNSSVITRSEDCSSIVRFGRKSETVYGYNGFKNVTVKNGTFDARHRGKGSLFRFAHASNVEINNITFKNTTDVNHLLTFAASENVRVLNCTFRDMKITEKLSKFNCEALQIDILMERYIDYPAYDGTRTRNVTVSGCSFINVPRGLGTHSGIAGYYFDNMVFKNNTFKNITDYAIKAVNYINSEISDNKITDCGSGISCSAVTNGSLVNFYAPLKSSDKIIRSYNVKISNNNISLKSNGADSVSFGIRLTGANIKNQKDKDGKVYSADCRIGGVTVEKNTITTSVNEENCYALHIDGGLGSVYGEKSDLVLKNNTVNFTDTSGTGKTNYGIRLENSANVYVYGNKITGKKAKKYNVHSSMVADNCQGITVVSNKLNGAAAFGIKLTDVSKAKVQKNSLNNIKSNGIYVYKGCKSVSVSSNKIKNTSGYGIALSDASVSSISSNSIYSPKKYAIYLTGNSKCTTISSNYICGGKKTGIYLNKKASATTITKNNIDIVSKTADGITVNDSASVQKITYNKINAKTKKESKKLKVKSKHGIRINSAACKIKQISNNSINQCADTGIYIAKAKTKATLSKNTVKTAKYGIRYKKGKAVLKKNTFKKCTKAKTVVIK